MTVAAHHLRDASLIDPNQCSRLMLKESTALNQKSNMSRHFGRYWWGFSTIHNVHALCQGDRTGLTLAKG